MAVQVIGEIRKDRNTIEGAGAGVQYVLNPDGSYTITQGATLTGDPDGSFLFTTSVNLTDNGNTFTITP